jgi:hypothetical protein
VDRVGDGDLRGQMEDRVCLGGEPRDELGVADVAVDEVEASVAERLEVRAVLFGPCPRAVVEDADGVAAAEPVEDEVRPDEPAPTRDQDPQS